MTATGDGTELDGGEQIGQRVVPGVCRSIEGGRRNVGARNESASCALTVTAGAVALKQAGSAHHRGEIVAVCLKRAVVSRCLRERINTEPEGQQEENGDEF